MVLKEIITIKLIVYILVIISYYYNYPTDELVRENMIERPLFSFIMNLILMIRSFYMLVFIIMLIYKSYYYTKMITDRIIKRD